MQKMLPQIIVIAKHGDDYIEACVNSLGDNPYVIIDTGTHHPTGAYLGAFREHLAESYLFIQDSMISTVKSPLNAFDSKMPELGAVAWMSFPYVYDNTAQMDWVERKFTEQPGIGIFGPIFYTNHKTLEKLEELNLLPDIPTNKNEAMGTERAWACAFFMAHLPVEYLYDWRISNAIDGSCPPFQKTFAGRV